VVLVNEGCGAAAARNGGIRAKGASCRWRRNGDEDGNGATRGRALCTTPNASGEVAQAAREEKPTGKSCSVVLLVSRRSRGDCRERAEEEWFHVHRRALSLLAQTGAWQGMGELDHLQERAAQGPWRTLNVRREGSLVVGRTYRRRRLRWRLMQCPRSVVLAGQLGDSTRWLRGKLHEERY
jgi:hypothetical protein